MTENEPKNPYPESESPFAGGEYRGWETCDQSWREYLASLVGDKGREEIATILRTYRLHVTELNSRKEQPLFNKAVDALADLEEVIASLSPIIAALADRLAEERIRERVELILKPFLVGFAMRIEQGLSPEYDKATEKFIELISGLKEWGVVPPDEEIREKTEYCPQHGYPLPCAKCGYDRDKNKTVKEIREEYEKKIKELEAELTRSLKECSQLFVEASNAKIKIHSAEQETARKMLKWGNEQCPHSHRHQSFMNRRECPICWNELESKYGVSNK